MTCGWMIVVFQVVFIPITFIVVFMKNGGFAVVLI